MEIKNAKIKNVTIRLDNKERVIASMEFHERLDFTIFVFKLGNPVEVKNLKKLMEFAEVSEFKDLEGKIVRLAFRENCVMAIGHPIEDRFVDVTNTMIDTIEELTESKLFEEYPE